MGAAQWSVLGAGRAGSRGSTHNAELGLVLGSGGGMLQAAGLSSCQGTNGNRQELCFSSRIWPFGYEQARELLQPRANAAASS